VKAYREAVALDGSVPNRLRFAQALWQTDQYYQAMNDWRAILGRSPGYVDARLALARAYVRIGSLSDASLEYQRLIQIAPTRPEARQELARLPRAARSSRPPTPTRSSSRLSDCFTRSSVCLQHCPVTPPALTSVRNALKNSLFVITRTSG
jgi:tetratricopeptide (TPR) repeat protein